MSSDPLVLTEYESVTTWLSDLQARRLAETRLLSVAPDVGTPLWRVTAGSYVGSLVVDDLRVLIRPKIPLQNLFVLLGVGLPESVWRSEAFDYAATGDLLPPVISLFARTLETTLARGVLHAYRERHEDLVAMRGRIDLKTQITRTGMPIPIACHFGDYTGDNVENRYLKAAVRLSLRVPGIPSVDRRRLLRQLVVLEDVKDVVVAASDLDRVVITRLNEHYLPALRLARLIVENLTLVDRPGGTTASSFVLDMNALFERFVTERLRRALRGRLEVRDQTGQHLDRDRVVPMRPDLEFRRRGSTVYVGDIKYKVVGDAVGRNADYYQLLAYTTAFDLPEGVLIYCATEGEVRERAITVRHAGKVLQTREIDLSGTPRMIDEEMDGLADWIAQRGVGVHLRTGRAGEVRSERKDLSS